MDKLMKRTSRWVMGLLLAILLLVIMTSQPLAAQQGCSGLNVGHEESCHSILVSEPQELEDSPLSEGILVKNADSHEIIAVSQPQGLEDITLPGGIIVNFADSYEIIAVSQPQGLEDIALPVRIIVNYADSYEIFALSAASFDPPPPVTATPSNTPTQTNTPINTPTPTNTPESTAIPGSPTPTASSIPGSPTPTASSTPDNPTPTATIPNATATATIPASILLVDDQNGDSDLLSYYTDALDALGVNYNIFDTTLNNGDPDLGTLSFYQTIIWFTGDDFDSTAGPDESEMADYLDNNSGICLFISSQDYLFSQGDILTPFMMDYLGASEAESDVAQTIVTGAGDFTNLGPYTLDYPISNFSDRIEPDEESSLVFMGDIGSAGISKITDEYRTTWWGFPFEAIPTDNARQEVMQAVLEWCNAGITPTPTPTTSPSSTPTNTPTTPTPTNTSIPTNTHTPTPTNTAIPTNTHTPTRTNTPTNTPISTVTPDSSTPTPTFTPAVDFGITAITPNEGMTSQTTDVTITGQGFVGQPSVLLRNTDGSHFLTNISRLDGTRLLATLPAKLPRGLYDLLLINPNGQSVVLANAFTFLDSDPAMVDVRPNQGVADLPNEITVYGFSFAIGTIVSINQTELNTTRINGTQLRAVVPADLAAGSYTITVSNPNGQQAHLANAYTVFGNESNNDLFGYSYELWTGPSVPRAGEQAQIGLFVHRQGGRNALANVRVRFFRDSQNGTLLGDGTIPFLDPPNDYESTIPLDVTFPEAGTFDIVAVIDPDNEVAEDTYGEINNVISRTVTIGDPTADQTVPVVNDILINDGAEQATTPNVSVDIRASDPNPNPSGMQAVHIIEYEYNIGASMWVPVQQSGWLPYQTTPHNYPWQLQPSAGMHYLQVRALDNATNISIGHAQTQMSYNPPSDSVVFRQTRIYRYQVAEGQQLEVVVEVISGDPDLYVWSSNPAESARVSNQPTGNEQIIVPADQVVPGVYQIEVYGYSAAEYQLQVTIAPPTTALVRAPTKRGPKPRPTNPVVPVSSVPDERQGSPPPPTTGTSPPSEYRLYLPAITR